MNKQSKGLIIFFVVCIIFTIFSIIVSVATKDKTKEREANRKDAVESNYELITKTYVNPKEINLNSLKVNEKDTPENLKDLQYVVIRRYQNKGEDYTYEYNASISNIGDLKYEKLTKEQVENVPVVIYAISDYISRTYKVVSGGAGTPTIRSETVNLYFYNTKTKTVFKKDVMKGKELPETTNSAHDYTKSLYDVERQIKKNFGKFLFPVWIESIFYICLALAPFIILGVIIGLKQGKEQKKK